MPLDTPRAPWYISPMSYLSKQGRRVWRSKKSRRNTLEHDRAITLRRITSLLVSIYRRPSPLYRLLRNP